MIPIRAALLSVSDKTGLGDLARGLHELGVQLLSTGGTARYIRDLGIPVREVAEVTGFPEILGGRVKTLHPVIAGGILARRDKPEDVEDLKKHGIPLIDLVVCNLYPFERKIAEGEKNLEVLVEEIDIGGVTLLRAAAKNWKYVVVVSSPTQYGELLEELKRNGGFPEEKSFLWALEAFARTSRYDSSIATYLDTVWTQETFPRYLAIHLKKTTDLRYGENPHQRGALYEDLALDGDGFFKHLEVLAEGKELSFNNLYDVQAAYSLVREFKDPAVVIVKHNNPCGAAMHKDLAEAARGALESDPVSAFGGIVAMNRTVTKESVAVFGNLFLEVFIAPSYEPEALELLRKRKNLRILAAPLLPPPRFDLKKIDGGFLLQDNDTELFRNEALQFVTEEKPTAAELNDLVFAFTVAKYVKSNAIVLAKGERTVGIGAGQMSRIDALRIAIAKAQGREKGAVLASDAFFPFSDVVEEAGKAGIRAIIQPGGSIRDADSIAACNRLGIAMVFTGMRHFRH
ncbi:bifunctional phosphoribosylaminoimidazolecarboxamide formyltransferase/IMP cyclohydrolase [Candidatus Caldatribacterium sp.]|uniref:bifunctional phosphoribosylaminoimidazolecarboxamide formyltransferase/IMP cyclohydrolase n=1 Tax=Candidatus Caldatribacterium sp. TaxID=2282143 RepID=UPI002995E876|nr:bifunctional phosphoribosylaminoimidazolecarboxamide formyltransferase/IMP cyclohydrolase [Candidatus Caldatribacterium sp.]MDW8081689.1 bifunctional phosphoribosylaminoimidazolecarboxamide formyltransferase/IMP cyclohydrolase [Candidatus Calescibacterium sp.]